MVANAISVQNNPLTSDQAAQVEQLVRGLDPEQLTWLSGYLAGVGRSAPAAQPASASPAALTVLYGSETGNAERIAHQAAEQAAVLGLDARVVDMADYRVQSLKQERRLLVVTSTHGDGAPPDTAAAFYEFLFSRKAPKLCGIEYGVLALGDSSYEHFCKTGKEIDARLAELGGTRLAARVDCDVDFEQPASAWVESALECVHTSTGDSVVEFPLLKSVAAPAPVYDRRRPFAAEVLDNIVLNGRGSDRETRHIELSIEDAGIDYVPGDVLCVLARNDAAVVDAFITAVRADPEETLEVDDETVSLREALSASFEITTATRRFVEAWAQRTGADRLAALLAPEDASALRAYLSDRWLIDIVSEYPSESLSAEALVGMLRRLQPREYSIASSQKALPDEIHVTVSAVRFSTNGESRAGVASSYLADRGRPGERIEIYTRSNKNFRLPDDPRVPIVMIGAGTGIAPYRGFIQEREEIEAPGDAWLFFGNPHMRTDFLYQTEWQRWLADGRLTRLDVAFSRDQAEKIYVQQRMLEAGDALFDWLERGAHLYVCGDADRLAPDVHSSLLEIIGRHGGYTADEAAEYLKALQRDKRYQRDVY